MLSPQQEEKRKKLDGFVKKLSEDAFNLTKLLAEGKPFLNELKSLESLVTKIRATQGHKEPLGSTSAVNPKRDWKPFFQWFRNNGFSEADNFEVVWTKEQGFGLVTKKDLTKADVAMEVPQKFMMTNVSALESAQSALLLHNDQLLQSVYSLALSIHLLIEKYDLNSFWAPYINSLPRQVLGSPLYWSVKELQRLEGSKALWEIAKLKAAVAKQYAHVYFRLEKQLEHAVMKREAFNWDAFLWSLSTVFARQNKILVAGAGGKQVEALALIPCFDLVNHEGFGEICSEYDFEKKCLRMYSPANFKAGSEIKMHYGDRPNIELVSYQGFFVPNNPNSFTLVDLSLLAADKLKEKKAEILKKHGLPEFGSFVLSLETPIPVELLQFLRVAWINSEEDLAVADKAFDGPITLQNELQAHVMLGLKLTQLLNAYPTKLEDDEQELAGARYNVNAANALNLLIEEKKILKNTQEAVNKKIAAIKNKIKEKEQEAK